MNENKRPVGRPKTPPRTGPLVLGEDATKVNLTMEVAADSARELTEYSTWVQESSRLTAAEAKSTTVEFALRELFRRDRLWQERRRQTVRPQASATAPTQPPAAASSAVLPPPVSSARPVPSPPASPGSR
jgi:hypothetical protein